MSLFDGLTQPQAALVAGLLGALGAVVASLIANVIGHVLTFRAQDRRRHDEVRRTAYARVARSVMAAWDGFLDDGEYFNSAEESIIKGAAVRDAVTEAQLLTRSKRADQALSDLHAATGYLLVRRGRAWRDVDRDVYEKYNAFPEAARKEIGLPRLATDTYETYRRDYFSDDSRTEP